MKHIVEICAGSYEDCIAAAKGGASRVELNSALSVGGLTPSVATLNLVKKQTNLKVICMVRPRAAGFCYNNYEKEVMLEEAKQLLDAKADGIAFGYLHEDGTIDKEETLKMVKLIHSYGKEAVFHRAFDVCKDPIQAMETLIACGVDRLLTSGMEAKAMDGADCIAKLQEQFGSQIEILAGSGVNAGNACELIEKTKISQVHSSCKNYRMDNTTEKGSVSYAYLANDKHLYYDIVDESLVHKLVTVVEK